MLLGRYNRRKYDFQQGFTIVELLIVIVIIGVLAGLVVVAYNGIQQQAQGTAAYDAVKEYKKSIQQYAINAGYGNWPRESDFLGGTNPWLNAIAADSRYSAFIKPVKSSYGISAGTGWFYDNDGDTATNCSAAGSGPQLFCQGFQLPMQRL